MHIVHFERYDAYRGPQWVPCTLLADNIEYDRHDAEMLTVSAYGAVEHHNPVRNIRIEPISTTEVIRG